MRWRRSLAGLTAIATVAVVLTGCARTPATVAAIGIARSQGGVIVADVRVCEGEADGIQLFTADDGRLVLGSHARRVATWTSPEPITAIGATDLTGQTVWPADPQVDHLDANRVYTMSVFSSSGATAATALRFTPASFDGLGVEQVLTADPATGGARFVSMLQFFDTACDRDA
ncbi:hypothetical protein HQQ80_20310 [Microbacteriaceae bacterium VKM Ac-2855]|nr:hypothetical protein [Microbacteriaceae bacterium VKM Ac-2855]